MRCPVEGMFLRSWMRHNYDKWKQTGRQAFIKTEFVPANYYIPLFQLKQMPNPVRILTGIQIVQLWKRIRRKGKQGKSQFPDKFLVPHQLLAHNFLFLVQLSSHHTAVLLQSLPSSLMKSMMKMKLPRHTAFSPPPTGTTTFIMPGFNHLIHTLIQK